MQQILVQVIRALSNNMDVLSLLCSLLAIVISIWLSRKASKDADKQIRSIKQLTRMHLETSRKQIEAEVKKNSLLAQQAKEEACNIYDISNNPLSYNAEFRNMMMQRNREKNPQREYEYYIKYVQNLQDIQAQLNRLQKMTE